MDTLKVHSQTITLVDQVEDKLLNYLKEKDIRTGDSIPNIIRKTKNSSFKNEKSKKEVDVTITVSNKDIV